MSKFNKIIKYNQYLCKCICIDCSDSVFIQLKAYLVKDDYFSQGFCKNCDSWRLESEINECDHCTEARLSFEKEVTKENISSIKLTCGEVEDYVLGLA